MNCTYYDNSNQYNQEYDNNNYCCYNGDYNNNNTNGWNTHTNRTKKKNKKLQSNSNHIDITQIFRKVVFFSVKGTTALQSKIGICNCSNKINCRHDDIYKNLIYNNNNDDDNIDKWPTTSNLQHLYQFEARYFQYSLLCHNILFIKDYSRNEKYKEFMIFKFGHTRIVNSYNDNTDAKDNTDSMETRSRSTSTSTPNIEVALYGVCVKNDRYPAEQPWHCKYIKTLTELLKFFHANSNCIACDSDSNSNGSNSSNSGGLGALSTRSSSMSSVLSSVTSGARRNNCATIAVGERTQPNRMDVILGRFDNNVNFLGDKNRSGLVGAQMAASENQQTTNSKSADSNCNDNNVNRNNIYSNSSSSANSNSNSNITSVCLLQKTLMEMQTKIKFVKLFYDATKSYQPNVNHILRKIKQGFRKYDRKRGSKNSANGNSNKYNNYNNHGNHNNNNNNDVKNFDNASFKKWSINGFNKFEYLDNLCQLYKIDRETMMKKLSESITNAFKFVREYPNTALTQVYIDEHDAKYSHELVICGEIVIETKTKTKTNNTNTLVYHTFGIAVNSKQAKKGSTFYLAKNILTPSMAANNIRLNLQNIKHNDNKTNQENNCDNMWIATHFIENENKSFFKYTDDKWYDNNVM